MMTVRFLLSWRKYGVYAFPPIEAFQKMEHRKSKILFVIRVEDHLILYFNTMI